MEKYFEKVAYIRNNMLLKFTSMTVMIFPFDGLKGSAGLKECGVRGNPIEKFVAKVSSLFAQYQQKGFV